MVRRTFNLRLWFAICSLGTIALICMTSAHFLTQFMTNSLLAREGKLSQEFLESLATFNGDDIFDDLNDPAAPKNPRLLDFAQRVLHVSGVVRVNIYAKTHRVLWSTEKQLVGKVYKDNDELDEAFKGKLVTEISTLDNDEKSEHVALGDSGKVIESYIPIHAEGGNGSLIGVVEFYRLPLSLEGMLQQGQWTIWLSALSAATLLYLVLYWIVQRGAVLIERQQESLTRMESMALIGQMASAVAHSLRNPMSAIRSSAELWHAQQAVDNREVTEEVIAEVDRMDRHVRDLLAYSRSEPTPRVAIDPGKVLADVLDNQKRAAQRNHIEVRLNANADQNIRVLADERLLGQALTSLVTNAIEAMPEGGRLDLSVVRNPQDRVIISINDTGRGIPAELLDRVTDSYFTTKTRGLGLGLILAKGIIERFDGKMTIASTVGSGTSVTVDLKEA